MRNIDKELINWAIDTIKKDYPEDVALLIGQKGACKIPIDEQNVAFDFFVPCTKRGYQLSQTFIIEGMGYDLFPISWERLEDIAELNERITFAFMRGEVLYARTKEDEARFLNMQKKLSENLKDPKFTYPRALESLKQAMEVYKNMMFDEDLSHMRKAAGAIMRYLCSSIATFNGTYLMGAYGENQFIHQVSGLENIPCDYEKNCEQIISASTVDAIREATYCLIKCVREFFKNNQQVERKKEKDYNYEDLADWYYEAKYTFRRLDYYCQVGDVYTSYELACYLQIENDAVVEEFGLERMDMLSYFDVSNLKPLQMQARKIDAYMLEVLKQRDVSLKIYDSLETFLKAQ